MKRWIVLCLVLMMMLVFVSTTMAKSVAVVISGKTNRPATLKAVPSMLSEYFADRGVSVVAIEDRSQAKVESPVIIGNEELIAFGKEKNADLVALWMPWTWTRYHLFTGYDAPGDFTVAIINVNTGEVVHSAMGKRLQERGQNNEALYIRGAALGLGTAFAVNNLHIAGGKLIARAPNWSWSHFGLQRSVGLAVGVAAIVVPTSSRCSTEKKTNRKAIEVVFDPLLPLLK